MQLLSGSNILNAEELDYTFSAELPELLLDDESNGGPSASVADINKSFGDDDLEYSLTSESTTSPEPPIESDSRPSSSGANLRKLKRRTFKVIEMSEVESSNEFDVFGKFIASELTHLPDIPAARYLKAKLQMLLANALMERQSELQQQTLQVVPQDSDADQVIKAEARNEESAQK